MVKLNSNLIRAYVDGEVSPEVAEQVRRHLDAHPEARAQVEFEQRLKTGVSTTMSSAPAAPAALSEAIRRSLAAERALVTNDSDQPQHAHPAPARSASPGWIVAIQEMIGRIARPRPMSAGAVLAVFALVGAAVLIGIFMPQIDTLSPSQRAEPAVADPAEYASQEHERCVKDPEHLMEKINFCSPHEAALALREHFGVDGLTVFDLTAVGYEFLGESRCGIPGSRQSAHLLYQRKIEGQRSAKVSVFIATARGNGCPKTGCGRDLRPGEWHRPREGPPCRKRVLQSTDSALVYYLVACNDADATAIAEVVGQTLLAKAR